MATTLVSKNDLRELATRLLEAAGATNADARRVAEGLVWTDLRGRHPQGVIRVPMYVKRLQHRLINSPARMEWKYISSSAEMLDAGNAFGHVAGEAAMRRAIGLAKSQGIGIVTVKRSNHNAAASYFCSLATEANCIGLTCTNAHPKVAAHGGIRPVFGTNPIAFGSPTSTIPILVDFSTSAISGSTTRSLSAQGQQLPEGVALDKYGQPTRNQNELAEGTLLPAAGGKGTGLALMVEILCGALAGAAIGKEVGSIFNYDHPINAGNFFLAIDIEKFQSFDDFLSRIDLLLGWMRGSAADGEKVRFPGEIRGEFAERYEREGIPLPDESVKPLTALARELNVELPWSAI